MPRAPEPSEVEAINISAGLLRFAAENKELPESLVATICSARDAYHANAWDHDIATKFWMAFNALCGLLRPVGVNTLSTNLPTIGRPAWQFWSREPTSLSRRAAGRYLSLLLILLFISVVLSFILSTAKNMTDDINNVLTATDKTCSSLTKEVDALQVNLAGGDFAGAKPEQLKDVSAVEKDLQDLYFDMDQLLQKRDSIVALISLGFKGKPYQPTNLEPAKNIEFVRDQMKGYFVVRRDVQSTLLHISVIVNGMTAFLPIILGLMGACAYVVRLISEQIRDTTFTPTSPIRHLVRVALGGLAGVVIGLGGIVSVGNLSASALAFLAGYAVEPVFSTFDSIAAKFRN